MNETKSNGLTSKTSPESQLAAVLAMAEDGVIGRNGDLPWRLSADLQRFKKLTMGGTLIMGRRTYDSIGRPLPDRRTIVVTRNNAWTADGVDVAESPGAAVSMAEAGRESGGGRPFVVGGAEIYRRLLPCCAMIYLTRVLAKVAGDTTLTIDLSDFTPVQTTRYPGSARDEHPTEVSKMVRSDLVDLWQTG